jgi:hypothetical protein
MRYRVFSLHQVLVAILEFRRGCNYDIAQEERLAVDTSVDDLTDKARL